MPSEPDRPAADFPSTRWSRIARPDATSASRRRDLEHLAQAYWRPVHAYLRARWKLEPESALDRTQEFFVWMFDGPFLERAERARGRFRALVKTALQNWLVDRNRADRAEKRGGDRIHLSLSLDGDDELRIDPPDPSQRTPDEVLDDRWRRELLGRALADVERECADDGRRDWYVLFDAYFVAPEPGIDYRALAERHGISTDDVSNRLRNVKQRYRIRLRQLVLDTVTDEDELERELHWLFGES